MVTALVPPCRTRFWTAARTSILTQANASWTERSLSLRQRSEIQAMPRRRDLRPAGRTPMRPLHRVLRRLGGGHDPRSRDEAGRAVPLPRRRLLHDLRAPAGRAVPQLRLRLAAPRQPVPGVVPPGPARRDDRDDALARAAGLHPVLGRTRPGRGPARLDARVCQPHRRTVLLRAARRALRLRAAGVPAGDAGAPGARRATMVKEA